MNREPANKEDMLHLPVYLDYNATTPCDGAVVEEMLPFFRERFGNAASHTHSFGWQAAEAVTLARERVAALINCDPSEIVFTSGATESINLALKGAMEMYQTKGRHLVTVVTEHKAVLDTCGALEKKGIEVTYVPVKRDGLVDLIELESAIRADTVMVAVMYVNNETGVVQPIRVIGALAKKHGVLFFSDAAQAAGKIPIGVMEDGIHLMSLSAHKLYGPKGVGALYVRRRDPRVRLSAQIHGGGHEKGMRSGTLNVPAIAGFGKACELGAHYMASDNKRIGELRDDLEKGLLRNGGVYVNGSPEHRLPNVTNLAFDGLDGKVLLAAMAKTIAVSSGSACTSALPEPSHVLLAMGLPAALAHASIRFSLGRFTQKEEVDFVIGEVSKIVYALRNESAIEAGGRTERK